MTAKTVIPALIAMAVFSVLLNHGHPFNVALFAGLVCEMNAMFAYHLWEIHR